MWYLCCHNDVDNKQLAPCCRVALKRGEAVSRELNRTYGDDKKMSKQEKEERQVLSHEIRCIKILYNTYCHHVSAVLLQCYIRQSIPMEQWKVQPSCNFVPPRPINF